MRYKCSVSPATSAVNVHGVKSSLCHQASSSEFHQFHMMLGSEWHWSVIFNQKSKEIGYHNVSFQRYSKQKCLYEKQVIDHIFLSIVCCFYRVDRQSNSQQLRSQPIWKGEKTDQHTLEGDYVNCTSVLCWIKLVCRWGALLDNYERMSTVGRFCALGFLEGLTLIFQWRLTP